MSRRLAAVVAAVAGVVAGGLTMITVGAPALEQPTGPPGERSVDAPAPLESEPVRSAPTRAAVDPVLLVWTAGALPDGLAEDVAGLPLVTDVAVVAGGRLDLLASDAADGRPVDRFDPGWGVPLDALAIDPQTYAAFAPTADRAAIVGLAPGEALLGSTSARLRGLQEGDTLTVAPGEVLSVSGVVDDVVVAGAEVVVARGDAPGLGLDVDRFLLVAHRGDRAELEGAIRGLVEVEVRVRGPGETPFLRHGDAVLPQALIKDRFGEFSYRIPAGDQLVFVQDAAWGRDHLVTEDLPILGPVHCHRDLVGQVEGVLQELVDRGLDHLVDPDGFEGCYNPRLVAPGGLPSRHAWGVALDLNAGANPTGLRSGQDPRLVDVFARWGMTWGGFWLVPDPMHVEYLTPPTPDPAKVVPEPSDRTGD